jgi:hypothetical protein
MGSSFLELRAMTPLNVVILILDIYIYISTLVDTSLIQDKKLSNARRSLFLNMRCLLIYVYTIKLEKSDFLIKIEEDELLIFPLINDGIQVLAF